eukprot:TRINITY_DN11484_c0_g1_i4.p1 TRINITY_DN11484_c0_g1~~TRINITY_DN11484_c0_g1_i4.p1  ORF type:complete len:395 (-),score=18.28 TRINITY_DN11484_c0_g1_i4:14-1198(-)
MHLIRIDGLVPDVDNPELMEYFAKFSPKRARAMYKYNPKTRQSEAKGYAFMEFFTADAAMDAVRGMRDYVEPSGRRPWKTCYMASSRDIEFLQTKDSSIRAGRDFDSTPGRKELRSSGGGSQPAGGHSMVNIPPMGSNVPIMSAPMMGGMMTGLAMPAMPHPLESLLSSLPPPPPDLRAFLHGGELKAALLSRPIFLMSVEWLCSSYCSPVELAVASLSVAGESLPTFHRFLDPGTVPEAYFSDAYFSERRIHGVGPTQWRQTGDMDFIAVFRDILHFTQYRVPIVYTKGPSKLQESLQWLSDNAGYPGLASKWEVREIEELVAMLHKAYGVAIKSSSCNDVFIQDHQVPMELKCQYHREHDSGKVKDKHCVLGDVKKMAIVIKNLTRSLEKGY